MMLEVYSPYPGTVLVVTELGSILFGAPADAFKATKFYCAESGLPFPRVLVAPGSMLVNTTPQFNPEFFLYDFLFIYGAAFNSELSTQKLHIVADRTQKKQIRESLRITLTGPTEDELNSYKDDAGSPLVLPKHVRMLSNVSSHMAIKKNDAQRPIEDMVEFQLYDQHGSVTLLDGHIHVSRGPDNTFRVRRGSKEELLDLKTHQRVLPFASLPIPANLEHPQRFGVKPLGVRSGFDLSGPSTGFLIWIEGKACIYDGPVGTRYLLETHGIDCDDIEMVVLSHCHEDHMGAFVELILSGSRPRVYTTEPIYRSALIKLSCYFQRPEEEVAEFIDYHRVQPGVPFEHLGANFELFYTIHAIPTVGIRVSYPAGSNQYKITISGDTYHHEGLDTLLGSGVLESDVYHEMKNLVPKTNNKNALYYCDVGESIIHGHPNDWVTNPNKVVYYHCPDTPHTRSFGRELAVPGKTVFVAPDQPAVKTLPPRLMSALRFLNLESPKWQSRLIDEGTLFEYKTGEPITQIGAQLSGNMFILINGLLRCTGPNRHESQFLPGEFFGFNEGTDHNGLSNINVEALCPSEILEVNADVLSEYIHETKLDTHLNTIRALRPLVDSIPLFSGLKIGIRNWVAGKATVTHFTESSIIPLDDESGEWFFVLIKGELLLQNEEESITRIRANSISNFIGTTAALNRESPNPVSALSLSDVELLRFPAEVISELFDYDTGIYFQINTTARDRRLI